MPGAIIIIIIIIIIIMIIIIVIIIIYEFILRVLTYNDQKRLLAIKLIRNNNIETFYPLLFYSFKFNMVS